MDGVEGPRDFEKPSKNTALSETKSPQMIYIWRSYAAGVGRGLGGPNEPQAYFLCELKRGGANFGRA